MKKIYRGWKALQCRTGLGYDPSTDRVICSDDAWQSFIQVYKECNHLRHKGLRNKELYYNVFAKNHVAGASGFGSFTMRDDSTPYVEHEGSMDNSGTWPILEEELTPTTCARHCNNRRSGVDVGSSRSRGSSDLNRTPGNDQSSRPDHMLMCMNIMTEMGIPQYQQTIMWHYFDAYPWLQRNFHQLPDDDRRGIIASVVKSQSPPTD
ncbi:hypothetical protein TIFTF001_035209 [Ficus carica]|uniref:Myb/SANT-like domain-containing protein n=1 Tax=Ficus carica TaxID=3494 RepID=A0AA88J666_FICCA|nr:hypothetical protein TIFTF001_035209 [Ficus carica]